MVERRTNAERRATTRGELLRLGIERYPLKGYSRTSIDELLAGSGLSKGAFYFHFDSKEQYFLELMRVRASGRGEWWRLAADPKWVSLEEIVVAVHRGFNPSGSQVATWVPIIADFALTLKRDWARIEEPEAVLAELQAIESVWMGELAQFVSGLQERGFARTDRTAAELATTVESLMDGANLDLVLWGWAADGVPDALIRILRP